MYKFIKLFLFIFFINSFNSIANAQNNVVINEILASNSTINSDEDGDYEDWIELYNAGTDTVHLGWYGLSDDYGLPFRWVIPQGVYIAPGEHLLIWASGKDRRDPAAELHTNFSISREGEEVLLTNPNGTRVDEHEATPIPTDFSYGRYPDGADSWFYFDQPTPGEPNKQEGFPELLTPPVFSHSSGFHQEPVDLELTSNSEDVMILFTLDGSEPDIANLYYGGTPFLVEYFFPNTSRERTLTERKNTTYLYTGPIDLTNPSFEPNSFADIITSYLNQGGSYRWNHPPDVLFKGNVVRAATWKNGNQSETVTRSFFITDETSPQFHLPAISITAQAQDLFGFDRGIYVPGKSYLEAGGDPFKFVPEANYQNTGDEWERPVHVDFIKLNGRSFFSQNAGARIHGGGSRNNQNKSMRLYARSEYDVENRFNHEFFPGVVTFHDGEPLTTFNRLLLRADGNLRDYLNDIVSLRLLLPTQLTVQRSRPFHHFINGEYWGFIYLRDRIDRFHIGYNYGIEPDNVIMIHSPHGEYHSNRVEEGTREDFAFYLDMYRHAIENDLSDPGHYEKITELLDVKSFIDYNIAFIYLNNVDWYGQTHFRIWRARETSDEPWHDGKWRYIVWDFDEGGRIDHLNYDLLYNAISPDGDGEPPYQFGNDRDQTRFLINLLENEEFQNLFINRFADHINSIFLPERFEEAANEEFELLRPDLGHHYYRFGFHATRELTRDEFIEYGNRRPAIQLNHIVDNFNLDGTFQLTVGVSDESEGYIRVNTIDILPKTPGITYQPYPWIGTYFQGVPVSLEAKPHFGFRFSHWEGVPDSISHSPAITIHSDADHLSITAVYKPDDVEVFPAPHPVRKDEYRFTTWEPNSIAGSFPESMAFVYMEDDDPGLHSKIAGFTGGAYNHDSRTRINGMGNEGIAFINTGFQDGNPGYPGRKLGGAILALDTREDGLATVSWTGGTVTPNSRAYRLRMQYRVGNSGPFLNVTNRRGNPVEYIRNEAPGHKMIFSDIVLPTEAQNKKYVQVLWRYYHTGEQLNSESGERDQLRLGDIRAGSIPLAIDLLLPSGEIGDDEAIELQWAPHPAAMTYTVEVSPSPDFQEITFRAENLQNSSYYFQDASLFEDDKRYYWRVSASTTEFGDIESIAAYFIIGSDYDEPDDPRPPDLPKEFALLQNFPNPFNTSTTIPYNLAEDAHVRIEIYNVMGQRVSTIVNETQSAGKYTVAFDARELSSGMYLYHFEAGGITQIRKMILVK